MSKDNTRVGHNRNSRQISVWVNPIDESMAEEIGEMIGGSRSDAIRTAIRVYHAILVQSKHKK